MQSVLSQIWTRVAMSISYDDNHFFFHMNDNTRVILYLEVKK